MKIFLLFFLLFSGTIFAEEVSDLEEETTTFDHIENIGPYGKVVGNIALTSDYNFRGQSQTSRLPAVQGGLVWSHAGGFHLGAFGSNVHYGEESPASFELSLSAGYSYHLLSELAVGVGITHYSYFPASE